MLNRVVLIGRLTKDPDLRFTPNGIGVCNFTLAVDRPHSKEREKEADFIPIVAWRQTAEASANYLKKGHRCAVEGRIQVRNYENNEGRRIYVTEVHADNVRFLESGRNDSGNSSGQTSKQSGGDPFAGESKPIDISDDDLPF